MPSRLLPSPALVLAVVAVVLALGGTAVAAKKLTGADILNNSLTSADVKDRSLKRADFATGVLPGAPAGPTTTEAPSGSTQRGEYALIYTMGADSETFATAI